MKTNEDLHSLSGEMNGTCFGDERLGRRLGSIADALVERSDSSFPEALRSEAALEGFYRFLRNDKVSLAGILEPHLSKTAERIIEQTEALVIHDTTQFSFSGEIWRDDLGWTNGTQKRGITSQGFFGHFALGLSLKDSEPLGVIGYRSINRKHFPVGKQVTGPERNARRKKETSRWGELVEDVEQRLTGRASVIHIMDREGDMYDLLSSMVRFSRRFVIRATHDRKIVENQKRTKRVNCPNLFEWVEEAQATCSREVILGKRTNAGRRGNNILRHPERKTRPATLLISARKAEIKKPDKPGYSPYSLKVNVVRVWEPNPPKNEAPVEWKLITTEEVDTSEEMIKIVDIYRNRWKVEEYFRALKTGCKYESRQMESFRTLENALAILIPVAWKILLLRHLTRSNPETPAEAFFTKAQLEVLRFQYRTKLPARMSIRDATLAMASLAGHHKSNGDPGCQILWRGYRELLSFEQIWLGAQKKM